MLLKCAVQVEKHRPERSRVGVGRNRASAQPAGLRSQLNPSWLCDAAHSILLLLLLSPFSRVWLCATPQTAAHQPPPSLGFSRKEHWSGLPFPSPVQESEKWKESRSVVSDSERPHGLQHTRLLHPWDFPGKSTGVGCHRILWLNPTEPLFLPLKNTENSYLSSLLLV